MPNYNQLLPNYAGDILGAWNAAKERKRQNELSSLAGQYFESGEATPNLLGQIARAGGNPEPFQQNAQGQEDRKRQRVAEMAGYIVAAPEGQKATIYAQVVPEMHKLGYPVPAQWSPDLAPLIERVATQGKASGTPAGVQEFNALTSGFSPEEIAAARRIKFGLDPRAGLPVVKEADGGIYTIDRANSSAAPVRVGGAPAPQALDQNAILAEANRRAVEMRRQGASDEQIAATIDPWIREQYSQPQTAPAPQLQAAPKASAEESYSQPTPVTNPQTGQVELVQFGNRGGRRPVTDFAPGPTARENKPPTEAERTASGYLSRMQAAEQELEAIVGAGYQPGGLRDKYTAGNGLLNYLASDEGQAYRQQQEDWVRAKLRKESGAVIGEDEMEREIRTYFPQPGDTKTTIANKKKSREVAILAMQTSAGRALQEPTGNIPVQTGRLDGKYTIGQVIQRGGKMYRVVDLSDPNDPFVQEIR